MDVFSEIYSTYYKAVGHVLLEAAQRPLPIQDIQRILSRHSFAESAYHILPKLQDGSWPLLKDTGNGYTAAVALPREEPLSLLQLAWLKSILEDQRIRLFFQKEELAALQCKLNEVPALFYPYDFCVFDKACDGDQYSEENYQKHFRMVLDAIGQKSSVYVQYEGGKGKRVAGIFWPYRLEYSSKDDKFRILCYKKAGCRKIHYVLNLGRVVTMMHGETNPEENVPAQDITPKVRFGEVTLEITRERNALERCMVQFAHFEKRTEYDENTNRYTCVMKYNVMDETELIIRILSFGPTVKVLGPQAFLDEIRRRVKRQTELIGNAQPVHKTEDICEKDL